MPKQSEGKINSSSEEKMLNNLDLQMEIWGAIAIRHPKMKAFSDACTFKNKGKGVGENGNALSNPRILKEGLEGHLRDGGKIYTQDEYDNLCEQIYGGSFPSAFPVWLASDISPEPWYLHLKIDLRFGKDEIIYRLKKWIDKEWTHYNKARHKHVQRKHVQKWVEYLQVWDLRRGIPPSKEQQIFNILWPDENKRGRPWTYERIAKYLNPSASESPKQLSKQIDRVKKQYRAAYRLIFGENYNHKKALQKVNEAKQNGFAPPRTCESCIDRNRCTELCPEMNAYLYNFEIKQHHLLTDNPSGHDIDNLQHSKRRPAAD